MYSSSGRFSEFADHILKNKIQSALGRAIDLENAEMIDWEFAGVQSNPVVHVNKSKKVLDAFEQGKGFNEAKAREDELYKNSLDYREMHETRLSAVETIDPDTIAPVTRIDTEYYIDEVLRDAMKYTELKPDFYAVRN